MTPSDIASGWLNGYIKQADEAKAEFTATFNSNPLFAMSHMRSSFETIYQGETARYVEDQKNAILEKGEITDPALAYLLVLEPYTQKLRHGLLTDADGCSSDSMFSYAAANSKRRIEASMLPQLESMIEHLKK